MREADPDFMLFCNGRSPLNTLFTRYKNSIVSCAPTRPCEDHVFRFLGALVSSRRFPESSILSCCSYLVVDAIHLCDGQRPDGLVRPPALCSQYKAGGCAKSAGFISGGDMKQICADPFPHGLHTIYYCAASSADLLVEPYIAAEPLSLALDLLFSFILCHPSQLPSFRF